MKAIGKDRFEIQKVETFTLFSTYGDSSFFSNPPSNIPSRSHSTSNQKTNQAFNKAELEAKLKKILENELDTNLNKSCENNNPSITMPDISFSSLTQDNEERELVINLNQSYKDDDPSTRMLHISFSSLTQDNEEHESFNENQNVSNLYHMSSSSFTYFEFNIIDCSGKNSLDN